MTAEQAKELLIKHKLKRTSLRVNIILELEKARGPVTQAALIESLGRSREVDRVSIFRNLKHMKATGLVHEVERNQYVACTHECGAHQHIVFYCQSCRRHSEVRDHKEIKRFVGSLDTFGFFGPKAPLLLKSICSHCS